MAKASMDQQCADYLPVLQMLNAANALECSIHHDCYAAAESFAFFHAASHSTTPH